VHQKLLNLLIEVSSKQSSFRLIPRPEAFMEFEKRTRTLQKAFGTAILLEEALENNEHYFWID
jgi:hypothetical protein